MPTRQTAQLSDKILRNSQIINRYLSWAPDVSPLFLMPYVNVEKGTWGRRGLIQEILESKGAVFPPGFHLTNRQEAVSASVYTREILDEVRKRWSAG